MKKLLTLVTLIAAVNVFGMERFDVKVSYSTLHATEAKAVQAGLVQEEKIKAGTFKSFDENYQCEMGTDVEYTAKSVEIKKLYIAGVAKYKTVVNAVMECEEEYEM